MGNFHLQIVTPDGLFFDGDAQRVVVRAIDGDMAIMARHIGCLTALGVGEARVTKEDGTVRRAACMGGMLSMSQEGVCRIVANTFEWAEDIDRQRAQASKEAAEEALGKDPQGAERKHLKNKLQRANLRLKLSEEKDSSHA